MAVGVHEAVGEAFVRCARRPDDDRAGEARLPTGALTATPHQALDCSLDLNLNLNDPTAWQTNPEQN